MGRRRCCCAGCTIFEDAFNRANSTNLGVNWTEYSGDWSIDANQLKEAGTNGAHAIADQVHPKHNTTGYVSAVAKNVVVDARYKVVVNWYDVDNHLSAVFWCDGTDSHLAIYSVAGGVVAGFASKTQEGIDSSGTDVTITLCRSETGLYARTNVEELWAWNCLPDPAPTPGYRAGLGNASTEAIHFDDFLFKEHWSTDPDCPKCECDCNGYCIPKALVATIAATGTCACWDGMTAEVDFVDQASGAFVWGGSFDDPPAPDEECPWLDPPPKDISLACTAGTCGTSGIDMVLCGDNVVGICGAAGAGWSADEECGGAWEGACPSEASTCKPFSLVFGPFTCDSEAGECVYTITVTERP